MAVAKYLTSLLNDLALVVNAQLQECQDLWAHEAYTVWPGLDGVQEIKQAVPVTVDQLINGVSELCSGSLDACILPCHSSLD